MTPRWRAVLQVQRLLRTLLTHHVPLGVLQGTVNMLAGLADRDLVKAEAHGLPGLGLTGQLARELAEQLVGEEPFDPPEARRRDLQRVIDEVTSRRDRRKLAAETSVDAPAAEVADELDELLAFLALEQAGVPGPIPVTPIASAFRTAADTWHGQREKWRDLIEHIRGRRSLVLEQTDREALVCGEGIARELQDLLVWIGKVQPDPRPPGEPRDLLRIHDELRRRRADAAADAKAATGDADVFAANALRDELDELLAFVLPLMGAPLPAVERVEAWLESSAFYDLMQAYRHAPLVPLGEAAARYEEIKAEIRKAVRA